jgi:hypothetical protein
MDAQGCCDCGAENCFRFTVRTSAAALKSEKSVRKAVCGCTKCLLVPNTLRAEVLLFDSGRFSSSGGTLSEFTGVANTERPLCDIHISNIICDVCKLCVGFQYQQLNITAVSLRVVNQSATEPTIPESTLSKYCAQYFSGN